MNKRYRYHNDSTALITVRGVKFPVNEYVYSDVPLLTADDLTTYANIMVDTDLTLSGTFTVDAGDNIAPANVTSLAGVIKAARVMLSWADPAQADLDHVIITHNQAGGGTGVTVAKGVKTYTWASLTNGTAYTFTVRSVDKAGNTSAGITVTVTPAAVTPSVPGKVNAVAGPHNSGEVTLSWVDPASVDFSSVQVAVSPSITGSPFTVLPGVQKLVVSGLTPETQYSFALTSINSAGTASSAVTAIATPR